MLDFEKAVRLVIGKLYKKDEPLRTERIEEVVQAIITAHNLSTKK